MVRLDIKSICVDRVVHDMTGTEVWYVTADGLFSKLEDALLNRQSKENQEITAVPVAVCREDSGELIAYEVMP
jgi:hypothetical protein